MVECGQFLRTRESQSCLKCTRMNLFYVKCTVQLTTTTAHEHTHIYAWHARRKPVGAEPIFGPGIALHGIASNIYRSA